MDDGRGRDEGGGGRAGRRDVRAAILRLLLEAPLHRHEVIQELERRSGGRWTPSPALVYPALAELEHEALVVAEKAVGRRVFQPTHEGRRYMEAHREGLGGLWMASRGNRKGSAVELADLAVQAGSALTRVVMAGGPVQLAAAREVLVESRRARYQIPADEDDNESGEGEGEAAPEGPEHRAKELGLRLRTVLGRELAVEPDLSSWFPLSDLSI